MPTSRYILKCKLYTLINCFSKYFQIIIILKIESEIEFNTLSIDFYLKRKKVTCFCTHIIHSLVDNISTRTLMQLNDSVVRFFISFFCFI